MVPSSAITIIPDGKRLTSGGFSLGETVHLGNIEHISDYFGSLSLSPGRCSAGIAFMGSTHSGSSTPWLAMIEDSAEEFLMASRGEGSFGIPSPKRRGTGASITPVTTTPWLKYILDITTAQQAESSFQCQGEASVSSPWGHFIESAKSYS
jgi:hypothetical protein